MFTNSLQTVFGLLVDLVAGWNVSGTWRLDSSPLAIQESSTPATDVIDNSLQVAFVSQPHNHWRDRLKSRDCSSNVMRKAPNSTCAVQRSLECKVAWCENQVKREVEAREVEGAKYAHQQEQLQSSRDALQKHLAVTEAEFRLALQVIT